MEITWRKTTAPDRYKHILLDYYLEMKLDSGESLIILNLSIEHPHVWNKHLMDFTTDYNKRLIKFANLTFNYDEDGKKRALRYVKALLQSFETDVLIGSEKAKRNVPALEI